MASKQTLESLKILAGGPSTRRQMPTEDYGFSGAVPTQGELSSPFEMEQSARAARADAADRERTSQVSNLNAQMVDYNRPDVTEMRNQQQADALRKLILPAQIAGQSRVQAAQANQVGLNERNAQNVQGRADVASGTQAAISARQAANAKALGLRQQIQAFQTGKAHAPAPTGVAGWIPGAQGKADQAMIANLLAQAEAADASIPDDEAPESAGALPVAPQAGRVRKYNPATGRIE